MNEHSFGGNFECPAEFLGLWVFSFANSEGHVLFSNRALSPRGKMIVGVSQDQSSQKGRALENLK